MQSAFWWVATRTASYAIPDLRSRNQVIHSIVSVVVYRRVFAQSYRTMSMVVVLEWLFESRSLFVGDSDGHFARLRGITTTTAIDSSSPPTLVLDSNLVGILPMEHHRPSPYSRNSVSSQDCENVNLRSSQSREMQFVANHLLDGLSHIGGTDGGRYATSWYW